MLNKWQKKEEFNSYFDQNVFSRLIQLANQKLEWKLNQVVAAKYMAVLKH